MTKAKATNKRYTLNMTHSNELGIEILTAIEVVEIDTDKEEGYATREEAINAANGFIGEDSHKLVDHIEKARGALRVVLKMKVE